MVPKPGETRADADRSFERLYEGHRGEVYRAALRELGNAADAEDVTQAAFVDAYRALLRGSRPRAPRAWLLAIAENVRRRRFRTALRRPREEPLDADTAVSAELSEERVDAVRSALTALPAPQREVFLLREVAGLSYDEIAERLDSTVASVQMLLFRARRTLRATLDPPPVTQRRRALGLQLPPWLVHFVGRGDPLALTPRGAGAIGAVVLAVTGVTAGALQVQPQAEPPSVRVVHEQPRARTVTPAALSPAQTAAATGKPLEIVKERGAAPGRPTPVSDELQTPAPAPAPARTPTPAVVQSPSVEPAPESALPARRPGVLVPPPARIADPPLQTLDPLAATVVQPLAPALALPPPALQPVQPPVPPVPPVVPTLPPVVLPVPPVVAPAPSELPPAIVAPPSPPLP